MSNRIMKGIAGFYYVHTGSETYECKARGLFRKEGIKPLVGDIVSFEILDETTKKGNILEIKERKNFLIRPAVANLDQALVVFSGISPEPNLNLLDRFLVMMEAKGIKPIILFTKSDLTEEVKRLELKRIYSNTYPVLEVSVKNGEGISELKELLKGKFSVLAGPSGVGKSSLTNYLVPEAKMEIGEVSRKTLRGKQTTRHSEIFYFGNGGYIFDTPGFGTMDLFDVDKKELHYYFPDFSPYEDECKFLGCVHYGEKDCGVKKAVFDHLVFKSRYENYRSLYEELSQKKEY